MSRFCVECGSALDNPESCPLGHPQRPDHAASTVSGGASLRDVGSLPKAKIRSRLIGSGLEYGVYVMTIGVLMVVSILTVGFADGIVVPFLFLMIAIRDVNAGLFSLAKRVGRMRVVEYGTGKPATNGQALMRNSYYLALTLCMAFPILPADVAAFSLFVLLVAVDLLLVVISRDGRRIGDLLAGTQVVHEAKKVV